ncbi:formate dehydrogenase accessory sulfurtransferase FdhD [Desulfotignum phosphitoxidans]|uniref:Sulfur carrier protein FdhD n=1 Tax=Desulfotignum phosphitoxidans DSM 13687 TaxID=1286635 RepID=S0G371_9BACT|nr:formate dehydrogenase accessory sulfurtransferase FdhD [Desulfotignum phosphitoxidans]EMS78181.1 formate dehydrogenase family accessory protein FdhD [Desulfotignum phosphitoxidans DSM 13687]
MIQDKHCKIITLSDRRKEDITLELIREVPLSIRVQGKSHTVIMRTPGDEVAHVAGFCLGEGLVDSMDDFSTLGYCEQDINVVTVTLKPERVHLIPDILKRKGFISQTSCGICGKELIDDLKQNLTTLPETSKVSMEAGLHCLDSLSAHQMVLYSCHAAALFTKEGGFLSVGEDVGRHNALDKSVGKLLVQDRLDMADLLVLSSRISYELVQKAARAGISVIFSVSGPTALAVELAESIGMALVSRKKNKGLLVFCGEDRLLSD